MVMAEAAIESTVDDFRLLAARPLPMLTIDFFRFPPLDTLEPRRLTLVAALAARLCFLTGTVGGGEAGPGATPLITVLFDGFDGSDWAEIEKRRKKINLS